MRKVPLLILLGLGALASASKVAHPYSSEASFLSDPKAIEASQIQSGDFSVNLRPDKQTILLGCPNGNFAPSCKASKSYQIKLSASVGSTNRNSLLYTYSVTGGRVFGEGSKVKWDLTGLAPGSYTATAQVDNGRGQIGFASTSVTVNECANCAPACPGITITCPDEAEDKPRSTVRFTANTSLSVKHLTFNWSVSSGKIIKGQGKRTITVDAHGLAGQTITATVELGGIDPSCTRTASCTTPVKALRD